MGLWACISVFIGLTRGAATASGQSPCMRVCALRVPLLAGQLAMYLAWDGADVCIGIFYLSLSLYIYMILNIYIYRQEERYGF